MRRKTTVKCLVTLAAVIATALIVMGVSYFNMRTGNTARVRELKRSVSAQCGDSLYAALSMLSDRSYEEAPFVNNEEQKKVSALLLGVLQEWVENGFEEWSNVQDEKVIVSRLLHSCSDTKSLGLGIVETDEELAIAQRAANIYNEKYMSPNRKIVIRRNEDGRVLLYIRNTIGA